MRIASGENLMLMTLGMEFRTMVTDIDCFAKEYECHEPKHARIEMYIHRAKNANTRLRLC